MSRSWSKKSALVSNESPYSQFAVVIVLIIDLSAFSSLVSMCLLEVAGLSFCDASFVRELLLYLVF